MFLLISGSFLTGAAIASVSFTIYYQRICDKYEKAIRRLNYIIDKQENELNSNIKDLVHGTLQLTEPLNEHIFTPVKAGKYWS